MITLNELKALEAEEELKSKRVGQAFIDIAKTETEKVHFLKSVCHMPYSVDWFMENPRRLNAMYKKEYLTYFKTYTKARRDEIEAENRLKMMKRLVEQEKQSEQECYPC